MVTDVIWDFMTSRTGGLFRFEGSEDCEVDGKAFTQYHARMWNAAGPIWFVFQAKDGSDLYLEHDGKILR